MNFRSLFIATIQTMGLYAAGFVIPVIGQFLALFAPVPIILVYVRDGRRGGLAVLAASTAFSILLGWQVAFIFLFSFGLMAVGTAEGMRRTLRMENIALLGGMLPVAAAGSLLALYFIRSGRNPITAVEEYFHGSIAEAAKIYTDMGLTEMASMVSSLSDRFLYYLVRLLPGIAITTSVLQAAACYGVARAIMNRKSGASPFLPQHRFGTWHAPDTWVWGLIAALGLIIIPHETAQLIGWNFALVFGVVYLSQGTAIVEFYLLKARLGAVSRTLIIAIILVMPTVVFVIALGIVDIWADFRKVRNHPIAQP